MNRSAKTHLDRIASQGCALCLRLGFGPTQAMIHHPRTGQGTAQRASHFLAIPLCESCHQGPEGVHGDKSLLRVANCTELDLLADVIERLYQ